MRDAHTHRRQLSRLRLRDADRLLRDVVARVLHGSEHLEREEMLWLRRGLAAIRHRVEWSREMSAFVPGPRLHVAATGSGTLDGLRFAVKDLIDVAGATTGGGNPDW